MGETNRSVSNTPELETERLYLRRFTENDMEAVFSIFEDREVNMFLPWFPLKSIEEAECFFEKRYTAAYKQMCAYRYAVCLKSDNIPIGYVNVNTGGGHELGYGLRKEFWHKGITIEAVKAVTAQVKRDGTSFITATHDIHNFRSGNVMKQLGMDYKYSFKKQIQPKDILVVFRMYQLNLDGQQERVYKGYLKLVTEHFVEPCVSVAKK